jgi:hypothetical protein
MQKLAFPSQDDLGACHAFNCHILDDQMTIEEDFLSELAQLANTTFVDQELARLQAQAAALQTAKAAYLQALQKSLPVVGRSDTIKLS